MGFWTILKGQIKAISSISDEIDTDAAAEKIKSNIWFKGPNVWILAFSIVIASVGLNVNSTAVIIGAMLISPLMGPITGIGLSLGTNDVTLMKNAAVNLLTMIVISLAASCLFFLISPLELANPTELEARTSPTIYDVLIALFGGLAGILENCRKEKGTVLSGVAIATALMPPLCTAGYGLANGKWHFFIGASFLFLINCVFIIIATYVMVKYFHFKNAEYSDPAREKKTRTLMTTIVALVFVPSVISAVTVVSDNNFQINVRNFVTANKMVGKTYVYDYMVHPGRHRCADIYLAGQGLSERELEGFYEEAGKYGIKRDQIRIREHALGINRDEETERLVSGIYKRADEEMGTLRARIKELEGELQARRDGDVPYAQIAREIRYSNPAIKDLTFGKGAMVDDSLRVKECLTVIATTAEPMDTSALNRLHEWLQVRLNAESEVINKVKP